MQLDITSEKKQYLRTIAKGVFSSVMNEVLQAIDRGDIALQGNSKETALLIKEAIKNAAQNLKVE